MLENAFLYQEEIRQKLYTTWYDDRYKYFNNGVYHCGFSLDEADGDWSSVSLASVSSNGEVIGLITYGIRRVDQRVENMGIQSFEPLASKEFVMDVITAIDDIFLKYNFRKLEWTCITDNPAYTAEYKFAKNAGGRKVCVFKNHTRLDDNKYHHSAIFEITRKEWKKVGHSRYKKLIRDWKPL